ncbi:hypothetical protein [Chryseobacterium daeguense]|uniref:hypothetical protein n=1 Tax=Chryseobacterium daeguense TaxID=412438 RepID=UPI00040D073A|nr:hypothetical protein [Chryseobacterium daeguense]
MADNYNSKQYRWKDLSITYGGRIIEGITENEYEVEVEDDFLYGRGDEPHDIVQGNKSYKGKITIWQSELEAMIRDAPNKDITKLKADIVNTYSGDEGEQSVTDICKNVRFGSYKKAFKQGDKNMLVEIAYKFTKLLLQQ